MVILNATPAFGCSFENWSGDASGSVTATLVTMDGHKNVRANFIIPGNIASYAVISDATPTVGDLITVTIHMDMTGAVAPNEKLGSFSNSLLWDSSILTYVSSSGLPSGFTGVINTANAAYGELLFNGASNSGTGGDVTILSVTFFVSGKGTSLLGLSCLSLNAATTLLNLMPVLTVQDGTVTSGDLPVVSVSGTFRYYRQTLSEQQPLEGVVVELMGEGRTYSTTTGPDGHYSLDMVVPGSYTVVTRYDHSASGAVNSLDAGMLNAWRVGPQYPIEKVLFKAGDVLATHNRITSGDASRINDFYLHNGIPPWHIDGVPVGLWSFWRAGEMTTSTQMTENFHPLLTVGSSPVVLDLYGLITGDFDQSGIALLSGLKSASGSVVLNDCEVLGASPGETILVPVKAGFDMTVGAYSLILDFAADLIEVEGIYVGDRQLVPVPFNLLNNQLRIGWFSMNPVVLQRNEALFNLKVKVKQSVLPESQIHFALVQDPLNQLGDISFKVIQGAELSAPVLRVISTDVSTEIQPSHFSLLPYPNPAQDAVNLKILLPESGTVTIDAYDVAGRKTGTLINQFLDAGVYDQKCSIERWTPGVYFLKLTLKNENGNLHLYRKLNVM